MFDTRRFKSLPGNVMPKVGHLLSKYDVSTEVEAIHSIQGFDATFKYRQLRDLQNSNPPTGL